MGTSPPLDVEQAVKTVLSTSGPCHFLEARGSAAALLIKGIRQRSTRPVLYVVKDSSTANHAIDDLQALSSNTLSLPRWLQSRSAPAAASYDVSEGSPYDETIVDRRREMARVAALYGFLSGQRDTLVIPARALLRRCVPFDVLRVFAHRFARGDTISLEHTAGELVAAGYLRTPLVEEPGELAIRGGLLDLWPAGRLQPVRMDLDADKLVSLKDFDPETQRSGGAHDWVDVPPAREVLLTPESRQRAQHLVQSLCDAVDYPTLKTRALLEDIASGRSFFGSEALLPAYYELIPLTELLEASTVVILEDPSAIVQGFRRTIQLAEAGVARKRTSPHFSSDHLLVGEAALLKQLQRLTALILHPSSVHQASHDITSFESLEGAPITARSLNIEDHAELKRATEAARTSRGHDAVLDPLEAELTRWAELSYTTTLTARTATQADRLKTLLSHRKITASFREAPVDVEPGTPNPSLTLAVAPLARGAQFHSDAFVLLTEEEVFGKRRHHPRRHRARGSLPLDDLRTLRVDDFVVHVEHGIGRYKGLTHQRVGDIWLDLLVVEYQGGDKLFLPVYRLNQIQKHATTDANAKLDRLGGQTFARTKARVRRRVRDMADELLRLYAERTSTTRPALPPPGDEYRTFEAQFPFEETPDQAAAIEDVLSDLERDVVMDRLVCGDVGFGKTEVALRATFRNVMEGRQVALLCPTTVLAQQHFLTFSKRLAEYPVSVRVLSRFQTKKAVTETLVGLKGGNVDIVVGTHRLLSKDVHFKNLGLLVVDEEQRFGVTHKERIKQLKQCVDVITLSATPIPRTLQMAISGIRDLSMISTPPVDRRSVRTIVSRLDDGIMRSAIERELSRGGQVFYVYNRVEGLEARAAHLKTLISGLRVAVAHGKQHERDLERIMLQFIRGDFDVLCSTAIVESGLDIPRANTMLIDRADILGLSQLYQLRGRVGRSYHQAYCYLMVPPPSRMNDVARARIESMQRYAELGSGFQIANMDMELRGTGDLLGAEQSGFVQTVGFELFCQMLQEATQELSGQPQPPGLDPDLSIDVEALIPEDYVDDVGVRLSVYKRLASADVHADVDAIATEVVDRFGPPPMAVRQLVSLMHLKVQLRELRALGCEATKERVALHFNQDTPLSAARIGALVAAHATHYTLSPTGRLSRKVAAGEKFESGLAHAAQMLAELQRYLESS